MRFGTLFATRASAIAETCYKHDTPWLIENPALRPGEVSIFELDEYKALREHSGAKLQLVAQCRCGSTFKHFMYFLGTAFFEDDTSECTHEQWEWKVPPYGRSVWAAHPPLRGTQLAVPAEAWPPERGSRGNRQYLMRDMAAYTEALNAALARMLVAEAAKEKSQAQATTVAGG